MGMKNNLCPHISPDPTQMCFRLSHAANLRRILPKIPCAYKYKYMKNIIKNGKTIVNR